MPQQWDIDLSDGRTVTVESDFEPTESEVLSALADYKEPAPIDLLGDSARQLRSFSTLQSERGLPSPLDTYDTAPEERQEQFKEELFKPIVPIPEIPISPTESPWTAGLKQVGNVAKSIPEFIESPAGILSLGAGAVAPTLTAAGFTADLLKSAVEQGLTTYKEWGNMTPAERAVAAVNIASSLALAGLTGTHTAKGIAEKLSPKETVPQPQIEKEIQNAAQIGGATPLPELEVRPRVDETTPLRPERETPAEEEVVAGGPSDVIEPTKTETPQAIAPEFIKPESAVDLNAAQEKLAAETDLPALEKMAAEATAQAEAMQKDFAEKKVVPNEDNMRAYQEAAARVQFLNETIQKKKASVSAKTKEAPGAAPPEPPVGETPPAAPLDWTSATEEAVTPVGGEPTPAAKAETAPAAGAKPATPAVAEPSTPPTELHAGIPIPKFANRKQSVLDRITSAWSSKLQKSFGEARRAQKEIKKAVPKEARQNAISVYNEAGGDMTVLKDWESRAKQKWMRDAAKGAQTLTPDEIAIAARAGSAFAVLETRGNAYDVLKSHRDNYVPHVWDVKRPGAGFGGSMLKQRFRFSKARTFDTFFDGDQAGFKPKTLAIGKLLPAYIHEMNKVIADRQFVRDIVQGTAKDGAPLAVPTGNVKVVDGPKGKAVLVQPKLPRVPDTSDYRVMPDQPALSNWTWEGKDTDGKPIFVKADLALHPEAFDRIRSALGESAIRQWYNTPATGVTRIPRAVAKGLDVAQTAMKREMFGLLAPFHMVQEGTHAIGHLVNPFFGLEKIDPSKSPAQADASAHGLMLLPDRASASTYLEGVGTDASLLSRGLRKAKLSAVADVIDGYQDYLFHQYIPALKFKTYEALLGRNMKLYADELKTGEMTPADVKLTSAEQTNAAYGHLNYALLDRNPTIRHLTSIAALAPDFLEARGRFVGQAIKGLSSPVGREQLKAVAILAAAQAGTALTLSAILGVPYDPKHPFEVIYKGRRYAMRSVPEDVFGLLKDTRQFLYSRVNPLTAKGAIQLATGLNYRGEKVGPVDTITELLAGYIPITARSLPGLRSLTETGRNQPVTPLQQFSGSLGLRVSRYSPISETYKKANDWMDSQKIPRDTGSYPISKYQQLRYALEDGDMERAATAYAELKKTMTPAKIASGFRESIQHPFTKSLDMDRKFKTSLKGYDLELYNQALRNRRNIIAAFHALPKG